MINYRELFYGVDVPVKLVSGSEAIPINFDNGATTPPLKSATEIIIENIQNYGPIARGLGQKGDFCTTKFEEARDILLNFFNLKNTNTHTVIFTKSDTEGLNLLSHVLIKNKREKVLTTRMEHHANDLPWRNNSTVLYVDVDKLGRINIDDIEKELIENNGEIKYVTVTAASNVTGYINPINDIARLCHKHDAKIIVDAAQLVAHKSINMKGNDKSEQIDFLTFSAHKAYAPFGSGAIIGLTEYLSNVEPFLIGGGCVEGVFDKDVIWNEQPHRLEAGTQNFFGVLAMAESLKELKKIGFENIFTHEKQIKNYIINEIKKINKVIVYGDTVNTDDRIGVIPFNIEGNDYEEIAMKLANERAIALRCGKFCAHPYVYRLLGISDSDAYIDVTSKAENFGMIRASLGLYNTIEEASDFLNALESLVLKTK